MKTLLKSVAAGIVGMGLSFCFFMMVSLPLLALRGSALRTPGAVTAPTPWFRYVGLPLSAIAFVASFVAGWKRFKTVRQ